VVKGYIKQQNGALFLGHDIFQMRIAVKLFGTLSDLFPDYDFEKGLELHLPEGSKVADLLSHLKISDEQGGTILMDSRVLGQDEPLTPGSQVLVFQALNGG
jgi:sulfur carrier protein ThiS